MTKTVLITGSSGYFGGIACRYFADRGWKVIKASRSEHADIAINLDHPEVFANTKVDTQIDLCIHAAAAHEVTCAKEPYRSIYHNVAGTRAVLDFCVNNEISRFVYLSTFHVFGNPSGEINELTLPNPLNDYGLTHLQAEQYVKLYSSKFGLNGMVIRPSNFFGIPADLSRFERWSLIPFAFCKEAIETGSIVLKTPGYQKRNFVAVNDICAAILGATKLENMPDVLHVHGRDTVSVRELATIVKTVVEKKGIRTVTILAPDGPLTTDNFIFNSLYLSTISNPSETLMDYVEGFIEVVR